MPLDIYEKIINAGSCNSPAVDTNNEIQIMPPIKAKFESKATENFLESKIIPIKKMNVSFPKPKMETHRAHPNKVDPDFIRNNREKYFAFLERQSKIDPIEQSDQILEVKSYLKSHRIPCFKYNYSLEDITQNFSTFQCYL